jgi:hypothetical protein
MSGSSKIAAKIDWASDWDRDAALTTAKLLLEIKAVNFRPEEPYTLTSGWKSPVYIDCRKIIFFPRARAKICDLAVEKISRHIGYEAIQAVAGGETAGIPFAAWIAERMGAPMAYIRKKPKGWWRTSPPMAGLRSSSPKRCAMPAQSATMHSWCFSTACSQAVSRPWQKWIYRCTIFAPGGMCWMPARTNPISPIQLWPGFGNSLKTRWPGRPRMAVSRVLRFGDAFQGLSTIPTNRPAAQGDFDRRYR